MFSSVEVTANITNSQVYPIGMKMDTGFNYQREQRADCVGHAKYTQKGNQEIQLNQPVKQTIENVLIIVQMYTSESINIKTEHSFWDRAVQWIIRVILSLLFGQMCMCMTYELNTSDGLQKNQLVEATIQQSSAEALERWMKSVRSIVVHKEKLLTMDAWWDQWFVLLLPWDAVVNNDIFAIWRIVSIINNSYRQIRAIIVDEEISWLQVSSENNRLVCSWMNVSYRGRANGPRIQRKSRVGHEKWAKRSIEKVWEKQKSMHGCSAKVEPWANLNDMTQQVLRIFERKESIKTDLGPVQWHGFIEYLRHSNEPRMSLDDAMMPEKVG